MIRELLQSGTDSLNSLGAGWMILASAIMFAGPAMIAAALLTVRRGPHRRTEPDREVEPSLPSTTKPDGGRELKKAA